MIHLIVNSVKLKITSDFVEARIRVARPMTQSDRVLLVHH